MKNDFEFIKEKMEKESIPKPEWLDEDVIREKLKDRKQAKKKFIQAKTFKGMIGLAACLIVSVICLNFAIPTYQTEFLTKSQEESSTQSQEELSIQSGEQVVACFTTYDELKQTLQKIDNENEKRNISENKTGFLKKDMAIAEAVEDSASNTGLSSQTDSSYAQTYKQVETVDEADILKNDGKYIYYVKDNTIKIYSAKDGETKVIATIDDYDIDDAVDDTEWKEDEDYYDIYVQDIFIYENRLIVNVQKNVYNNTTWRNYTETAIYDLSTISKPEKIKTFKQSGAYMSSRMIGEQLYLVSNDGANTTYKKTYAAYKEVADYVPCTAEDDGENHTVAAKDIAYLENPSSTNYLVVSSIDTKTCKKTADTKAVLGAADTLYCNENNMYITQEKISYSSNAEEISYSAKTQIVKVKLSKEEITFAATGKVNGYLYGQFAIDEKDGYLRVATTSTNKKGKDVNNLYILDENLNLTGKVTGFAEDESIKAVRYIDDKAYVITYEQTDPLFIIDLSNPKNPEITGSVKITGFSSLLVPVDENTLLGIGYNTEETELGEALDGIKFALFDISDSNNPKVLDSKVMENSDSEAQYDHKALIVNPKQDYYAIPYTEYAYEYDESTQGVVTLKVVNNKIQITNKFESKNANDIYRCTYIDNYIYAIDYQGNIISFKYLEN